MQSSASLGLCRFQNSLRPSNQCQCSTSFAARHRPRAVLSATGPTSSSSTSSDVSVGSSSAGMQPTTAQQMPSPPPASQPPHNQQQPTWQQQQRKRRQPAATASQRGQTWDYKYKWQPCPTPCTKGDERCFMVEALIQNVLSYPIMHPRVCRCLPRITADINSMTRLVEQMASHFGKELTLVYITKDPLILQLDFSTVLDRIKAFRELFGVLDSDVPMMLRKHPGLLALDSQELRQRYDNVRELTRFNTQQMRAFVLKFPLAFGYNPAAVRTWVERLQQLCFTRDEWTRNYQLEMTPSLMAFFLRDAGDQLLRLEYLASTGERPEWHLRAVMKPSDKSFRAKTKNFTLWEQRVKARRAQQRAATQASLAQQHQRAEADAIKAALLAEDDAAGMTQQQQQQQPAQPPQQ